MRETTRTRLAWRAGAAWCALIAAAAAQADTLRDALVQTYGGNPTLTGARAQLRALDEGVGIARAEGRPSVSVSAGINQDFSGVGRFNSDGRALTGGVNLGLPLFTGGRVGGLVRGATARVDAGRADLRAVEGDVFTEAVGAYMDVIRDQSIVELNRNQVKVLETNLQASRDRFEVGDLTRTDVAQSDARLAGARSQLATAEGRLAGSNENYRRVIGKFPENLAPPPPLPPLPPTSDQAAQIALDNNPDLISITASARAAGYDINVARAARLPTLSATTGVNYTNRLGSNPTGVSGIPGAFTVENSFATQAVGLTASLPLYQGGGAGARVRQAQALQSQTLEQTIAVERSVIAQARANFASYQAAQQTIAANDKAVSANRLALEGARAENSVGTRTVLDVLNAEQELLNSQVALVTARRDLYVAGFALLNAMGRAEARDLGLDGGPLYDPLANYNRVSRRWSDYGDDPRPAPQATRTIDTAGAPLVQTPVTPPAQ